jgi:hypothetical protein
MFTSAAEAVKPFLVSCQCSQVLLLIGDFEASTSLNRYVTLATYVAAHFARASYVFGANLGLKPLSKQET